MAKVRYNLMLKMKQGNSPLGGKELDEKLADFPEYKRERLKREVE